MKLTFGRLDSLPRAELLAEESYWRSMARDPRTSTAARKVAQRHAGRCSQVLRDSDGRRMAETGTGSGRSPTSAGRNGIAQNPSSNPPTTRGKV